MFWYRPIDRNILRAMETDAKQVVREWNREIEEEIRRDARRDDGPWKIVGWAALAVLWFVALFAALGVFKPNALVIGPHNRQPAAPITAADRGRSSRI
jgi:hypothetical protein